MKPQISDTIKLRLKPEPSIEISIPVLWLKTAMSLPGKTVGIAMILSFLRGGRNLFMINQEFFDAWGLNRFRVKRALLLLERAGLITVNRCRGRHPIVSIVDLEKGYMENLGSK
jgi:hypothetical protein